jgi:membrane fusion protein, multidrug efflux system
MRPSRAGAAHAALLALSTLVAGCGDEAPPRAAPPPPKVTVVFPEARDITEEERFNGWTAAVATVDVRSRVRGHIEQVNFEDGDIVEKGQLLFTLDARPFEADVEEAIANRRVFEAQLVAESRDLARLQELLTKGGASQKQVDKKDADVKALEAQIKATSSQIERLQLNVEFSRITAPIAGRASRAQLTEGNLVGAGGSDPVLTTVVCTDPIEIYFDVPERSLLRFRSETQRDDPTQLAEPVSVRQVPFEFGLETDTGYPRQGVLDFAENLVDAGTGTLRLRGIAPNPDGFLVAGSRVRVRLRSGKPLAAVLVPDTALLADQSLRYVLVVGPDEKVLRRDVRPGRLLDDGLRVVLPVSADRPDEGLKPTDRVIVEGLARARLHEPVEALDRDGQPVPAGAAPAAGG